MFYVHINTDEFPYLCHFFKNYWNLDQYLLDSTIEGHCWFLFVNLFFMSLVVFTGTPKEKKNHVLYSCIFKVFKTCTCWFFPYIFIESLLLAIPVFLRAGWSFFLSFSLTHTHMCAHVWEHTQLFITAPTCNGKLHIIWYKYSTHCIFV